jgi:AmmeMemoRadiSam system protein A
MELTADQRRALLEVARRTIRSALAEHTPAAHAAPPSPITTEDPVLRQPAGCFVTLHNRHTHRLRGCVGRLDSRHPLIDAVQQAAGNVLHDPRFVSFPVTPQDLPELELEITVIFPLQPAQNCLDFDPETEGIYLTAQERAGCFLPQVARETGWTREQLLSRLCVEKLGLESGAWQDSSARLMKFHTMLIGPEPFVVTQPT